MLLGAGGRWAVIDEVADTRVVGQRSNLSCGPASAQMLIEAWGIANIDQTAIENLTGAPTSAQVIAEALNQLAPVASKRWQGGYIEASTPLAAFRLLLNTKKPWLAQMKEFGNRIAHIVVVDGQNSAGLVLIRDPWESTSYKMEVDEFLRVWSQIAVF